MILGKKNTQKTKHSLRYRLEVFLCVFLCVFFNFSFAATEKLLDDKNPITVGVENIHVLDATQNNVVDEQQLPSTSDALFYVGEGASITNGEQIHLVTTPDVHPVKPIAVHQKIKQKLEDKSSKKISFSKSQYHSSSPVTQCVPCNSDRYFGQFLHTNSAAITHVQTFQKKAGIQ